MKDTAHITKFTPLEQLVICTNGISLFVNVNFVAEFSKATQISIFFLGLTEKAQFRNPLCNREKIGLFSTSSTVQMKEKAFHQAY